MTTYQVGEPWLKGVDAPHPQYVALEASAPSNTKALEKPLLCKVTHPCTQIQLYGLPHLRGSPTAPSLSPQRKAG